MNSFYGVLGTPACRFSNPALANSITGLGRELLLWSKRWFEGRGFRVLYGDTDSLFVHSGRDDAVAADAGRDARGRATQARAGMPEVEQRREQLPGAVAESEARELAAALNAELEREIGDRWRVDSKLELEFEKLYVKLFLPHARGSARGASKRYAGLVHRSPDVEFVGMEVVRRDWTALAKQVQRELYRRLFAGEPVDAYLADIVRKVRSGALDDALVYRKNLRKSADDYTAATPPHVAAARKSTQPQGRLVSYVMTTAGAEPLDNRQHPLDREHYVAKQVRPVAEPVLETLGLDFESAIGDRRQAELF
jgi:DNA polymerase-2